MSSIDTLNASLRDKVGTNSTKKIRFAEKIPAIVYGDGKNPEPISLDVKDLRIEINKSSFLNNSLFYYFTLYVEIKKIKSPTKKSKEPSFIQNVFKVLFADIMISFDNVIGVVGAAKGNFGFMIFGLVLSVVLTGALATYLANYIQKHLWIVYIGLGFILLVAIQLVIGGLEDLDILSINEQFKKYF